MSWLSSITCISWKENESSLEVRLTSQIQARQDNTLSSRSSLETSIFTKYSAIVIDWSWIHNCNTLAFDQDTEFFQCKPYFRGHGTTLQKLMILTNSTRADLVDVITHILS